MLKQKKLLIMVAPILLVVLIGLAFIKISISLKDVTEDSIKFKEEYEKFNNKKADNDKLYLNVDIDIKNNVKYSTFDEIIDVIENKTGVIYLGFPECPWCRNLVPVLLEAAKNTDVEEIYYINIKEERDSYVVVDNKLSYQLDENNNEIKGSAGYLKLLKVLDEYLDDYVIEINGEKYETGEKRIYAPTVIFVRDGEILDFHVSTVPQQSDPYIKLTDEEHKELLEIFEESMNSLKSGTCAIDSAC